MKVINLFLKYRSEVEEAKLKPSKKNDDEGDDSIDGKESEEEETDKK